MNIVFTHNYFTFNPNITDKQKYIDAYKEIEFDGWGVVNSGTKNPGIINAYSLKIYDYFLFDYFKDYLEYIPIQHQQDLYQTVLSNPDDLEPSKVLEFIRYLAAFLEIHFPNKEFYYTITVLELPILNGNSVSVNLDGKKVSISTSHTTFTDLGPSNINWYEYVTNHKHQAKISFFNSAQSKWEEDWLDIEDGKQLKTENKTLVFKKIYLGPQLEYTMEHLKKMCQLAIELSLKVKRNTDWV